MELSGSKSESIGAPGFEPGTSPTRTVRATRLRHAPRGLIISEGGRLVRRGAGAATLGGDGGPCSEDGAKADSALGSGAAGSDAGGRSGLPATWLYRGLAAELGHCRGLRADAGGRHPQRPLPALLGPGRAGEPGLLGTALGRS